MAERVSDAALQLYRGYGCAERYGIGPLHGERALEWALGGGTLSIDESAIPLGISAGGSLKELEWMTRICETHT